MVSYAPTSLVVCFLSLCHLLLLSLPSYSYSATALSSSSIVSNKQVCIAGGGPCGLFLAALLVQRDATVQITILERSRRWGGAGGDINAFGIGIGARLAHSLESVPGLREEVESVSALTNRGSRIISRTDLTEKMTRFLEKMDRKNQCQIIFDEGCESVDLDKKEITTTSQRKISYDLLVGADGINSSVRRALVDRRGLKEVHYLEPSSWKALRMPPQPDLDKFAQARHPQHTMALLPRFPEGHILLIFFKGEQADGTTIVNPGNLNTPDELKAMVSDSLQDVPSNDSKEVAKWKKLVLKAKAEEDKTPAGVRAKKCVAFDDKAVNAFLKTRPGKSHYMKVNRFHDDSVALIGDAAHGMNSLLGQGCAAGFKYTEVLAEELTATAACGSSLAANGINDALKSYSKRAVRGAHAITDLNRIGATFFGSKFIVRVLAVPIVMLQKILRRKSIFEQIMKVDVPYEKILRDNLLLLPLAKLQWLFDRVPFRSKETAKA